MKLIDKTPFQDNSGQISFVNRIQGTLKFGLSWYANLDAQKKVIPVLNKVLEKGYTLVRNQQLGASEIVIPLILIGPAGIYMIEVTPLKGFYRARGNEWGALANGKFQPVSLNILVRTERLAKVLQLFYERQGIKLPGPIEPVLLAADPGMHIESVRPTVRVVMSDAIERFAASLLTARPVYNTQSAGEMVERLINPHSANKPAEPEAPVVNDPFAAQDSTPFPSMEPSRMQSILNAPKSDALIDAGQSEIGFALDDADTSSLEPTLLVKNPPENSGERAPKPARPKRFVGMLPWQIATLVGIFLCWCAILAIGVYFILPLIQSQP
jgi:hypothetical protein